MEKRIRLTKLARSRIADGLLIPEHLCLLTTDSIVSHVPHDSFPQWVGVSPDICPADSDFFDNDESGMPALESANFCLLLLLLCVWS